MRMSATEEHKQVEKRRALGRGLDSLLPSGPRVVPPPVTNPTARPEPAPSSPKRMSEPIGQSPAGAAPGAVSGTGGAVLPTNLAELPAGAPHTEPAPSWPRGSEPHDRMQQIPLDLIDENPYQTRTNFDEAALNELADSIKANGLAQPVVVRPGANGRYILVLGERRCRASKLAGKKSVSAILRQLGNEQAAEMTIVENLQRQDLNCLEQAHAFVRLSREFNLTQEQIGQRTGVSRESVANYMRLLKLPKPVLDLIGEGKLGFSEARVLLEALPHMDTTSIMDLAFDAVDGGLTVRHLKLQVERLIHPQANRPEPR